MKGFKEFIMRPTLIDTAVGLIMALALKDVVDSLVKNLIMPLIGTVGSSPTFDQYTTTINGSIITWGSFLTSVTAFVFLGIGVYLFVVKPFQMYQARKPKEPEEAKVDEQVELLKQIRDSLQK